MLKIKYSKDILDIQLSKNVEELYNNSSLPTLSKDEIIDILNINPIYSEGLDSVIAQAKRILIILPDVTRKSGAEIFLDEIIKKIEENKKDFSIIFAIGTHRQLTEDEQKSILTEELYNKYRHKILKHDCEDMELFEYYGKTKNNTPILINRAYLEHDTIIPIASVSYHYFAGFGGGRKMIVPGIAAKKTIMANHSLVLDPANKTKHKYAITGNLKQNPIHDDLVYCLMVARRGKTFFLINTILNEASEVVYVSGGDLFMSHITATEKLKELTSIKISKKYDAAIISCGGFPKDINLVQAQKSLDRGCKIVKDGGKIIFFAKCQDGYGNKYFEEFFDIKSSEEMFDILLRDYQINRQTAFNLKSILEKYEVYIYSDFSKDDLDRMGFKKLNAPNEIDNILTDSNEIAFIPDAYNSYFDLS
ncbi:nickel-dependent lactate racemase [Deferribacterales bacterium Es71-Z0220]|uniref:nickel-dependent lactate racemase n=1 Tax=Deferrivibrio essentukiensis TaxID=2880922 RepID=UPI001F620180|nr:nickel-dependent lactate racemase [Deferrivibrio essentukiensis]MCB4203972.1 nickel-dependent lactate racemase [Deferrivibrio essentukiensis]